MPKGKATRKAKSDLDFFYLKDASDVIPLMSQLLQIKWQSTLRAYSVNGAATWDLQIENQNPDAATLSPQDRVKTLHLGDVAVYDSTTGRISTMRIEDYQTNFTTQ